MESIWTKTCEIEARAPLKGDTKTEIAVIGAGMAGVLIASALQDAGHAVIVLEANRIASGQTRGTTAKITSQHGLCCHKLIRSHGREKAAQYAAANEAAIAEYRRMVRQHEIACDLQELNACVYGSSVEALTDEVRCAKELGIAASFTVPSELPFPAAGAVCFAHQAQFHPLKFLRAVAEPLTIFEQTPAMTVEDDRIETPHGTVRAERIVFACHYPFVNFPGLYFTRMHQERSYVLALENAPDVHGMWIGEGEHTISLRNYGGLLLLGGGGHRTGENPAGGAYETLRQKARLWYPQSREAACWSAQDCVTADDVPYIGQYAASTPSWYVATGFRKWGMTSSMVAAMVLRDMLSGRKSPYEEVFDPQRFGLKSAAGVAVEGGHAVKGLTQRLFQIPSEQAEHIPPGHGGVVELGGEKAGVYRDEDGTLYPVSIRCRHLGCQLAWNPDEKSWDCPCHGSRYDRYGRLLSGPAQEDIAQEP